MYRNNKKIHDNVDCITTESNKGDETLRENCNDTQVVDCVKAIRAFEEEFWYVVSMAVLGLRWTKDVSTGQKCLINNAGTYIAIIEGDSYFFHRKMLTDAFVLTIPGLDTDFSEIENYIFFFNNLVEVGAIDPCTYAIAFDGTNCEYIRISRTKLNKGIKPYRAALKQEHSA
jgi:hypothetical protein